MLSSGVYAQGFKLSWKRRVLFSPISVKCRGWRLSCGLPESKHSAYLTINKILPLIILRWTTGTLCNSESQKVWGGAAGAEFLMGMQGMSLLAPWLCFQEQTKLWYLAPSDHSRPWYGVVPSLKWTWMRPTPCSSFTFSGSFLKMLKLKKVWGVHVGWDPSYLNLRRVWSIQVEVFSEVSSGDQGSFPSQVIPREGKIVLQNEERNR